MSKFGTAFHLKPSTAASQMPRGKAGKLRVLLHGPPGMGEREIGLSPDPKWFSMGFTGNEAEAKQLQNRCICMSMSGHGMDAQWQRHTLEGM